MDKKRYKSNNPEIKFLLEILYLANEIQGLNDWKINPPTSSNDNPRHRLYIATEKAKEIKSLVDDQMGVWINIHDGLDKAIAGLVDSNNSLTSISNKLGIIQENLNE